MKKIVEFNYYVYDILGRTKSRYTDEEFAIICINLFEFIRRFNQIAYQKAGTHFEQSTEVYTNQIKREFKVMKEVDDVLDITNKLLK